MKLTDVIYWRDLVLIVEGIIEKPDSRIQRLEKLKNTLVAKDEKIASLENQLLWFRKNIFGRMSEKHLPLNPNQLSLFDSEPLTSEQISEVEKANEKSDNTVIKLITAKNKPVRKRGRSFHYCWVVGAIYLETAN